MWGSPFCLCVSPSLPVSLCVSLFSFFWAVFLCFWGSLYRCTPGSLRPHLRVLLCLCLVLSLHTRLTVCLSVTTPFSGWVSLSFLSVYRVTSPLSTPTRPPNLPPSSPRVRPPLPDSHRLSSILLRHPRCHGPDPWCRRLPGRFGPTERRRGKGRGPSEEGTGLWSGSDFVGRQRACVKRRERKRCEEVSVGPYSNNTPTGRPTGGVSKGLGNEEGFSLLL